MKFVWLMLFAVTAVLLKENSCVPHSIRTLSKRAIIFPEDNWDDCFLDAESTQPGLCKTIEECPEVLTKWNQENIYPKNCYFIKAEQFVCCPIPPVETVDPVVTSETVEPSEPVETPEAAEPSEPVETSEPLTKADPSAEEAAKCAESRSTTKRHSNIFLDKVQDNIVSATQRPSNIFLDNLNADTITSQMPSVSPLPHVFNTDKAPFVKRRSQTECELQNQHKFETSDVNGSASEIKEFPFMAVLGWQSSSDNKIWYACGGVLISSRFVLTAAHCAELGGEIPTFVHLGDGNLKDSQEGTIKIRRFIKHPDFNASTISNDIALVELEEQVNNPTACLSMEHDLPINKLTALGYGHANFESFNLNQLFKAALTVIDKDQCQAYFKLDEKLNNMEIVDAHLCAGDVTHAHSSCQGDTGGPLIMESEKISYVVGITAFGLGCADLPPSIYTRVASFIDWIEPIVWPEIDVRID